MYYFILNFSLAPKLNLTILSWSLEVIMYFSPLICYCIHAVIYTVDIYGALTMFQALFSALVIHQWSFLLHMKALCSTFLSLSRFSSIELSLPSCS